MDKVLKDMSADSKEAAKLYMAKNHVPQLFESLTAGLLHHRPECPVEFVQDCLESVKDRTDTVRWDTFIAWKPPPGSRTASRASTAKGGRSDSQLQ